MSTPFRALSFPNNVVREQNLRNLQKTHGMKSRFKGVSRNGKSRRWKAELTFNRIRKYLGIFRHEADAARAYEGGAREFNGAFARPNFNS